MTSHQLQQQLPAPLALRQAGFVGMRRPDHSFVRISPHLQHWRLRQQMGRGPATPAAAVGGPTSRGAGAARCKSARQQPPNVTCGVLQAGLIRAHKPSHCQPPHLQHQRLRQQHSPPAGAQGAVPAGVLSGSCKQWEGKLVRSGCPAPAPPCFACHLPPALPATYRQCTCPWLLGLCAVGRGLQHGPDLDMAMDL